jgi:hypothetical protein
MIRAHFGCIIVGLNRIRRDMVTLAETVTSGWR